MITLKKGQVFGFYDNTSMGRSKVVILKILNQHSITVKEYKNDTDATVTYNINSIRFRQLIINGSLRLNSIETWKNLAELQK